MKLHETITAESKAASAEGISLPAKCLKSAQGRLAKIITDRVRQAFLETAVCGTKSSLRAGRLTQLKYEVKQAQPLQGNWSEDMQGELHALCVDTDALGAIDGARALQQRAQAIASRKHVGDIEKERSTLVAEAMEMLRKWRSHSDVAQSLCIALIAMIETGGEEFKLEMEKRGIGVLGSTVADLHSDRPEVMRNALRLLCATSVELLIGVMEEQPEHENLIVFGLEMLNKRAREDPSALDDIAMHGGREMVDIIEPLWKHNRIVALHVLNLKRRLNRCQTKSNRKLKPQVSLPDDHVVRLRECFESLLDEKNKYAIGIQQTNKALQMLGLKMHPKDLEHAVREVDVDRSGMLEWPEFLWLMSKAEFNMEQRFTDERLAEMREVFHLFDANGDGNVDAKELGAVMRSTGLCPTDQELHAMIQEVDADGSGSIEWPEFLYLMARKVPDLENQHQIAFEFFDKSSTGKIDIEEFIETMQTMQRKIGGERISREALENMVFATKFEDDNYSQLTYKEFVRLLMRN